MIVKDDCLFIGMKKSTSCILLANNGFKIYEPYKKRSRWAYRIRSLMHRLSLEGCIGLLSGINQEILGQRPKAIVILGSLIYEPFIKQIRFFFPNIRIKYSYENIVSSKASISPQILEKYNIEGWSWDKKDCRLHNLHYIKPYFNAKVLHQCDRIKYDVCFVGLDKGRYKTIKNLQNFLEDKGFKCFIKIVPNYSFLLRLHSYYSEPLSYNEYLDVVASSRCIIDLVQNGQQGTTMRVFEALFGQKKLITNNLDLVTYDFYKKQNIFVLGKDPIERICEFLNSDYVPICPSKLNGYTINEWIKNIIYD